jgi:2-C-methyl-D-erythritol 4-phosphate cytidylyltransferase/2-C-methyl-D-erythritol 2,4-cyclodiphosphate synthase
MSVVALIVAAGRSARLGRETPKQYLTLAGTVMLRRTAAVFLDHPAIDSVLIVYNPADQVLYDQAVQGLGLPPPPPGGDSRRQSVLNGLERLAGSAPDKVLIHDAARPFVTAGEIDDVVSALDTVPGAISALPVVDTLKRQSEQNSIAGQNSIVENRISETVARDGLWRAQTPQGFRYAEILSAHRAAVGRDLTDDAAVAEAAGLEVALVVGDAGNFKITTAADMALAENLLMRALPDIRVGQGIDAHRFAAAAPESGKIMLCGVAVAHDRALVGHSDADVGLHALTDALLAAIGDHDIGHHFPPGEALWRGAASDKFARFAGERIAARSGVIAHVDVTLICERPKIGPQRDAMRQRIGEILNLDLDRVSVKATTTEKMGFTGRGEGIAAQAVATVRLPG